MLYVPYGSILIAFVLIYVPRFVVGWEMKQQAGGYDNNDPRGQQARLDGRGKRALAAHQNTFEAFAPFAAAVLCCGQAGARLGLVAIACAVFVAARVAYIFAYLADKATLRSSLWAIGMLCIAALFALALAAL